MRISDWSSEVCSSDLGARGDDRARIGQRTQREHVGPVEPGQRQPARLRAGGEQQRAVIEALARAEMHLPRGGVDCGDLAAQAQVDIVLGVELGALQRYPDFKIGTASCRESGCQYA